MKEPAQNIPCDTAPLIGAHFDEGQDIDLVLATVATQMSRRGYNVAGLVQTRGEPTGDCVCREMNLRNLATGQITVISEKRGPQARGCHLDWEALTGVALSLEQSLNSDTDLLIINRFGRSESEGRGFRGAIEKALSLGLTIIVAHRAEYQEAWQAFHAGLAVELEADSAAILSCLTQPEDQRQAAC